MIISRIVGAVLFVGAIGCAIASSIVLSEMVEDINRVSRTTEQESPMGWHFGKLRRVRRKYRMLYPDGIRNKTYVRLVIAILFLGLVGAVLMIEPNLFGF
jgi:hypothetical protein